jgi:hypothetical protein
MSEDLFRDDFCVDGEAVRQAIDRREAFNVIEMTRVVKADFVVRKESMDGGRAPSPTVTSRRGRPTRPSIPAGLRVLRPRTRSTETT